MAEILIIDDDKQICLVLSKLAKRLGHQTRSTQTVSEALESCRSEYCDLVLLDLELPDGNGLSILPELRNAPWAPEVIIITGTGDMRGAELAFKYGAWDFIPKPWDSDQVILSVSRALQFRGEKLAAKKPKLFSREGIVGESTPIKTCLDLLAQAAVTDTAVLITGETGTGKELAARAIHKNSARASGRFVVVDCASLPESLIESALFGHEKGAFTGATVERSGLIKQAQGGTLFLDEIGELAPAMQRTFLRVLQEHRFRPVGGSSEVRVDFRLVAATHRDLDAMVAAGKFRRDLLYRIRSIAVHMPPLRERRSDILSLIMNHLEQKGDNTGLGVKEASPEFIQMLRLYGWTGNVRELINTLDHALATGGEVRTLHPIHLPPQIRLPQLKGQLKDEAAESGNPIPAPLRGETLSPYRQYRESVLEAGERQYLTELMRRTRGRIKAACEISGLSPSRLHALLKKYDTPRFRSNEPV